MIDKVFYLGLSLI